MIPHIATVGTTAASVIMEMCDASGNDGELHRGWVASWKDVAPYLLSRGFDFDAGRPTIGLELNAEQSDAKKGFLALKLLDDMDASGWKVSFAEGSMRLQALL